VQGNREIHKWILLIAKITVDTSVIAKWFKIEEDRERALKLRSWAEVGRIKLVTSVILLSECARGRKKVLKVIWKIKELRCSRFLK
jgi:hypothetical protein